MSALTLLETRRIEAKRYLELHQVVVELGVGGLTVEQLRDLEERYQQYRNGEFAATTEEALRQLTAARISKCQERVRQGLPPFESTYFPALWRWEIGQRLYQWEGQGRTKPQDSIGIGPTWKPKWVDTPNPFTAEGRPRSAQESDF